jgi:hypothetical protein
MDALSLILPSVVSGPIGKAKWRNIDSDGAEPGVGGRRHRLPPQLAPSRKAQPQHRPSGSPASGPRTKLSPSPTPRRAQARSSARARSVRKGAERGQIPPLRRLTLYVMRNHRRNRTAACVAVGRPDGHPNRNHDRLGLSWSRPSAPGGRVSIVRMLCSLSSLEFRMSLKASAKRTSTAAAESGQGAFRRRQGPHCDATSVGGRTSHTARISQFGRPGRQELWVQASLVLGSSLCSHPRPTVCG